MRRPGRRRGTGCRARSPSASPPSRRSEGQPGGSTVKLPRDWRDLIESLCSHRVRFLVVGAHALAAHGRPRATGDLDLLVEPTRENASRLGLALASFGFPALAARSDEFSLPDRMATLGHEPLRIDIMTSISGVSFAEAWRGRLRGQFDKRAVGFLGKREFVKNKKSAGRPKDLLDLALLAEAAAKPARRKSGAVNRKSGAVSRKKSG
jgi:hypothetical protein